LTSAPDVWTRVAREKREAMSLRGNPVELETTLPDGRTVMIRVGVPNDSYIAQSQLDTVTVELSADGEHIAAVNTVLDAEDEGEARALARELASKLSSGELEPTAGAIEPLAESAPPS
jgi:hypothetical protein